MGCKSCKMKECGGCKEKEPEVPNGVTHEYDHKTGSLKKRRK